MSKITVLILLLIIKASFFGVCDAQKNRGAYEHLKNSFLHPPAGARPKVYWWCLNGNIDTLRAKQELRAMKEAGISGFDLFEIGVPKQDTVIPPGPAFLSEESLQAIKCVIDEAGKLGLTVGLNLSSSWNAGGSWVEPRHGGKSLYFSKTTISDYPGKHSIKLPFPEVKFPKALLIGGTDKPMIPLRPDGKPLYYEEVAVLAIPVTENGEKPDTANILDISAFLDSETDSLHWNAPPGTWDICRYVCANSGQQLVLPSPHSAGLTIDHFDSTAVETHLMYIIDRLTPVLGDFRKTALKSFYLASYEARGFVWSSTLPAEFQKINGYSIIKFIPSFFNPELFDNAAYKSVQADFKRTLSEMMIHNLYKKSRRICNSFGLEINSEAGGPGFPLYNGPAEPLKALGSLDIPRGEFWINHSRFYKDTNGIDSIDILRVVKEVAAASHIYQKKVVEEEAFTSFQHWQEGPFDIKFEGDRAFCEGMNKVVFHGFSHNPTGSGYPGYVYNAGTHFNDKRVWWPKVKPFVEYLTRISSLCQEASFVSDVVYYYGDKIPNSGAPKNTHFKVGAGYDYEIINTEILLNDLSFENGRLTLSNGAEFKLLALESEETIHPDVLKKINLLIGQGAVIAYAHPMNAKPAKPVKIRHDVTPLGALQSMKVGPDFNYAGKDGFLIDFIHYRLENVDFYFVANTSGEWVSRQCQFRQTGKIPEIWDPVTGKIVEAPIYREESKTIQIPLTFTPFGSVMVVFRNGKANPHFTEISGDQPHPPLFSCFPEGFCLLEDGDFKISGEKEKRNIVNKSVTQEIAGSWELFFPEGWDAPVKTDFPRLISLTESELPGIRYFSGIVRYEKKFNVPNEMQAADNEKIFLDLGALSKVGEVWLNGIHLGITWAKPYRFDVTKTIKPGENHLVVEVANTWSNRIVGDAILGEKHTHTNITTTLYPGETNVRTPWKRVPLIPSGLLGPVTIRKVPLFGRINL